MYLRSAVVAGIVFWILSMLFPFISQGAMAPANVLVIDGISALVICIVATLAGAWIYKEEG